VRLRKRDRKAEQHAKGVLTSQGVIKSNRSRREMLRRSRSKATSAWFVKSVLVAPAALVNQKQQGVCESAPSQRPSKGGGAVAVACAA
jgi:hypothetical protein